MDMKFAVGMKQKLLSSSFMLFYYIKEKDLDWCDFWLVNLGMKFKGWFSLADKH